MQLHQLKTLPEHFQAVWDRKKRAELRKDDRNFAVGDDLLLQEWKNDRYTGRAMLCVVKHKLVGGPWLAEGYAMLSIRVLERRP